MGGREPRIPITPATKVAALLESWPELEETLIAMAPAFRRLRNPVLRRTVGRVATLEQAAGVGGVPVRELVAALRRAAGIDAEAGHSPAGEDAPAAAPPPWLEQAQVVATIDADAILDAGEVPLARIHEAARALRPGETLQIESGFRPVPLLDALSKQGFRTFVRETPQGRFETFVSAA